MKKLLLVFILCLSSNIILAQFVAVMEIEDSIEGLCNQDEVYALFPMIGGQKEAVCPLSEKEILKRLNKELSFLVENPKFKGNGLIHVIVNCEGIVVEVEMDGKNGTGDIALDQQIIAIFEDLGDWKPGRLSSKKVDSVRLYGFKIKKGEIIWD